VTIQEFEGMGLSDGTAIYREYLRRVSMTLNGTLQAMVAALNRLANIQLPDTMCPLAPTDVWLLCQDTSSSSSTP
jgi:hypothetical protein